MKWRLVAPEADATLGPPSGGYLYNHELMHRLSPLNGVRGSAFDVTLIDALNATEPVTFSGTKAALVHMAPPFSEGAQRFFASVDLIIGVSASVLDDLRERFSLTAPCRVVEAGCDHFVPLPRAPSRRLLAIGHLLPHKGVLEALEVCAGLEGEWSLDWLGATDIDADYTKHVMEHRHALGLESRVNFPGRVRREVVTEALSHAAALLSTSYRESWGLAAVEALVSGVPLVTWTTGGVFDRARASQSGHFVERNDLSGLREGLAGALAGRPDWSANALAVAKTFHTWDDCAREMIAACSAR